MRRNPSASSGSSPSSPASAFPRTPRGRFRGSDLESRPQLPVHRDEIAVRWSSRSTTPMSTRMSMGPLSFGRHQNRRAGNSACSRTRSPTGGRRWPPPSSIDQDLRRLLEDSAAGPALSSSGRGGHARAALPAHQSRLGRGRRLPDPFWPLDLGAAHGVLVLTVKMLDHGHVLTSAEGFDAPDEKMLDRPLAKQADPPRGPLGGN